MENRTNKKALAYFLGVSRSTLYYQLKQPAKDWELKTEIEEVLHSHHSYGHKRIARHLKRNKKSVLRVMKLFGIKPYRRRRKPKDKGKTIDLSDIHSNLLLKTDVFPRYPNHIWASDFTYIPYKTKFVYLATVLDIFTREIVGFNVLTAHNNQLVINALLHAGANHSLPEIIHSDQGREYTSKDYLRIVKSMGIKISMSRKGSPWENGYQEAFYSQFKVDLGDPNRFDTLGELIYNISQTIYSYNNDRIHSALKMPPSVFAKRHQTQRSECVICV
jgi:transposase InsO family protein|tara:strand:+ start:354 stop:1178 length:825 start_codon:yes stop_codon:yes gene_type:complete